MKQRGCSYFRLGLKREYKVCNFGLKERSAGRSSEGERSAGLSNEGRDPLVTQADLSALRVCSPAPAQLHKKGLRHRRKIRANSFWLYSYFTQTSPSKNKNINYMFIYQRVLGFFLSLRVFGLLSSSLLLFPQRFDRCVLQPSSGVCRTRKPSRNFELHPLLNPRGSSVLILLAITGYKC